MDTTQTAAAAANLPIPERTAEVAATLLDSEGYEVTFIVRATAETILGVRSEHATRETAEAAERFHCFLNAAGPDAEDVLWATIDVAIDNGHALSFALVTAA